MKEITEIAEYHAKRPSSATLCFIYVYDEDFLSVF